MMFARGPQSRNRASKPRRRRPGRCPDRWGFACEALEDRRLLSAGPQDPLVLDALDAYWAARSEGAHFARVGVEVFGADEASPLALTGSPVGFTPQQLRHAYGFDQIFFSNGAIVGDGTGQTIAIVTAYHAPTIEYDLGRFNEYFGIPAPPSFTIIDQSNGTTDPAGQGTLNWELETALDVEWTHAMAPGASIVLIQAKSNSFADMVSDRAPVNPQGAIETARQLPGVSVISMSWGALEFDTETNYDSKFTTPSGHTGITYVAATGDTGSPGTYPAYSPNVLAVGGTRLTLDGPGNIVSETGWSGSGGGISQYENKPSYQNGVVTQSSTKRTIPDVALDADPSTEADLTKGIPVFDSWNNGLTNPWIRVGGTSFSAPVWSSLIAIANQGRAQSGLAAMNGRNDTLPLLYGLPAGSFNDIISGSNGGFSAAVGYDLVTGRGSPRADLIVAGLIGRAAVGGQVYYDTNGNATQDGGEAGLAGWTVYQDLNGNSSYDPVVVNAYNSLDVPKSITHTTITSSLAVSGLVGRIVDVNVTLNISHPNDSDMIITLISPAGTRVTLANRAGGSGDNYSGTTFDDSAATPIASGTAPFVGAYKPTSALAALFGAVPNGTWTLEIQDVVTSNNGTLTTWSVQITSGDPATVTNSSGSYRFIGLAAGTYKTAEVLQAPYTQTSPPGGVYTTAVSGTTIVTNLDFGNLLPPSAAPSGVTLLAASDTGISSTDQITRLNNSSPAAALQFDVAGTIAGATVTLLSDGTPIGSAVAQGSTTTVTTDGSTVLPDGPRAITARQTEPDKLPSASSAPLVVIVDTQAPLATLVAVSPDPRATPVSQMTILFNEWVVGVELVDFALSRDSGGNLLSGSQTVTSADGISWILGDLSSITAASGFYELTMSPAGAPITDRAGNVNSAVAGTSFTVNSTVLGRYLFYNRSAFDDGTDAISPLDTAAIAPDKSAYLPGAGLALFENVSSYSRGINGIMLDMSGSHPSISASDFVFKVGNNNTPSSWSAAPTPSAVSVLPGAGVSGSDRVAITWTNGSISNKWLEVQVLSTANTGLAATDVFFWGSKVGDSGSSSPADKFETTTTDSAQVFATLGSATITNLRDYNRSGVVDTTDASIVFASLGNIPRLNLAGGGPFAPQGGGGGSALPAATQAMVLVTPQARVATTSEPQAASDPAPGALPASQAGDARRAAGRPLPRGSQGLDSAIDLAAVAHWWRAAGGGASQAAFDLFDEGLCELLAGAGRQAGLRRR